MLSFANTLIYISSIISASLISLPCSSNVPGMFPPQGVDTLSLFSVLIVLTPDTCRGHSLTSFRSSMKCHLHSKDIPGQPIQNCNYTITNSPLSPSLFPFYILVSFVLLPSHIQYILPIYLGYCCLHPLVCKLHMRARIFFLIYSLLYLQYLEQCLIGSRCSINICQMNSHQ